MTEEQEKELNNVYSLQEGADLTDSEIDTLVKMFDKPENFVLLRKVLRVLTPDELGISYNNDIKQLGLNPEDWEKYGKQVAIVQLADEKIRQALFNFYKMIQTHKMSEKRKEFEIENQKKIEQEKINEEVNRQREEEKQIYAEHL